MPRAEVTKAWNLEDLGSDALPAFSLSIRKEVQGMSERSEAATTTMITP